MSLAPSRTHPTPEPAFDLDYSLDDVELDTGRDTHYLTDRMEELLLVEGHTPGGRTLDVACGIGKLPACVQHLGGEGWGIDASPEMLGLSAWIFHREGPPLVRGIAEQLPYRDGTFDRLICQGALDHFVNPGDFMREAARVLKPEGRLVLALANYESLSCRLGRLRQGISHRILQRPLPPYRLYWQIPPDHFHKGDLDFVLGLGGDALELERCYGVSMLWLLKGWGKRLEDAPYPLVRLVLKTLDRIAYRRPRLADMLISVWRPRASIP